MRCNSKETGGIEMNDKMKSMSLGFAMALGLFLIIALGMYSWNLNQKVEQLQSQSQMQTRELTQQPRTAQKLPSAKVVAQVAPQVNPQVQQAPAVKAPSVDPFIDPWATMAIDPFDMDKTFMQMQKHMDEMMNRMQPGRSIFSQHGFGFSTSVPVVNMTEKPDKYEVVVTVPQGKEVELNTEIENNRLIISGRTKTSSENNSADVYSKSVSSSQFSQSVTLDKPVDESAMKTEKHGKELVITIPKVRHS